MPKELSIRHFRRARAPTYRQDARFQKPENEHNYVIESASCATQFAQSLQKFCEKFDVSRPSTMVLFFESLQFTVDFTSKHFPYKRKQEIRRNITENGGTISYILNNKVCQSSEVDDITISVLCFSSYSFVGENKVLFRS